MIDANSIPILEPSGRISFSSGKALFEHAVKHLLDGREERWSQLIDADTLAEARLEVSENKPEKPMLLRVAREYHRLAVSALCHLCQSRLGHHHLYKAPTLSSEKESPNSLPDGAVQIIEAWELEKKLLIIAKSFVSNGDFTPYLLCSAYRPFPKLSGNSLRKNIIKQLRQRKALGQTTILLETHDEP